MAASEQDIDFAKKIATIVEELQAECIEIRMGASDASELELLDKVADKCKMCLHALQSGQNLTKKGMLIKIIQRYSQALLDATYVVECRLVNEDFPQDRSEKEIKHIIDRLDQPEQLVKETFGSERKVVEVLGTDMVECLHWRRGALFYMYCHTLFNDTQRRQINRAQLMECAESGVVYLESMMSVRSPVVLDEQRNSEVKDTDMVNLLKEGVFSDTHLLALMYAGELCYWYWQIDKATNTELSADGNCVRNFDSVSNGMRFLQKFVDVVKGSLQEKGWDCSRAEQIIAEFRGS